MDNGVALPLDKLSSGEKQILIMFYLLLFEAGHGSLVIIDEPEISLHVAWQQSLGKTFSDIARLRDMCVIVATHSPQVIHDRWDLSVELKVENDR
jgi:predicted ATP-binding protein involved in virulence